MDTAITVIVSVIGVVIGFLSHLNEVSKQRKQARAEERERYDVEMRKYADSAVKQYAAERDFNHIRNELAQLRENMGVLLQENETLSDRVDGLKSELQHIKGGTT
ncbi:MAG: hypothetical protein AAFU71_12045 [Cyanobacteria bacterium J06632_22]